MAMSLPFERFGSLKSCAVKRGAAGLLAPVMLVDPNQVLHAFDVVTNKWYEGKFEDYLVGEFVWDTHVFNPDGVVVAISKV